MTHIVWICNIFQHSLRNEEKVDLTSCDTCTLDLVQFSTFTEVEEIELTSYDTYTLDLAQFSTFTENRGAVDLTSYGTHTSHLVKL